VSRILIVDQETTVHKFQRNPLLLLEIDNRAVSRNERSNENAKIAPAEENRTLIFDTGMKEK